MYLNFDNLLTLIALPSSQDNRLSTSADVMLRAHKPDIVPRSHVVKVFHFILIISRNRTLAAFSLCPLVQVNKHLLCAFYT